jgi:hypothetical protein
MRYDRACQAATLAGMRMRVWQGNIVTLAVDAIVNANALPREVIFCTFNEAATAAHQQALAATPA